MPSRAEVVSWLEEEIRRGDYGISGKLPSEVEMTSRYRTSRNTLRDALQDLQAAEVIEPRERLGWYVRPDQRRYYPLVEVSSAGWATFCEREGLAGRERPTAVDSGSELLPGSLTWEVRNPVDGAWVPWALKLSSEPGNPEVVVLSRAGAPEEVDALKLNRRAQVLEVDRGGARHVFDVRRVRLVIGRV